MKEETPVVSVIVPTWRRPDSLSECLHALTRLDFPRERLEVVVVDDGGNLPDALIDTYRADLRVSVIHQSNAGPAAARNAGAARAEGAILAFTDDDCRPAPDWLRHLVGPVAADPRCMAGGRTVNALADNTFATASQLLVDFLYDYYNRDAAGPRFFTSNNVAVDAASFRDMGGFDTSFPRAAGEDRDFCDHWLHRGGHLRYVPAAVVSHAHHTSLRRFWRQHFAYGTGAWRFHRARARRRQGPVRVEPLSFYARLVGYPLRHERSLRAAPLMGLMLLSQVANVAGYVAERRRAGAAGDG